MKKVVLVLIVLACALVAVPAFADGNVPVPKTVVEPVTGETGF